MEEDDDNSQEDGGSSGDDDNEEDETAATIIAADNELQILELVATFTDMQLTPVQLRGALRPEQDDLTLST